MQTTGEAGITGQANGVLTAARGAAAALFLSDPTAVTTRCGLTAEDRGGITVVRLLGLRHVAELALLHSRYRRRVSPILPLVDGTHAASMLAWAAVSARHRRLALTSAALAGVLGGLQVWANRQQDVPLVGAPG